MSIDETGTFTITETRPDACDEQLIHELLCRLDSICRERLSGDPPCAIPEKEKMV